MRKLKLLPHELPPSNSLEEACEGSHFVLEAALEDLEAKKEIFREASATASHDAVFASNTSTLSIPKISESFPRDIRSHIVGMHFFNPPQVMKLVEIARTEET